MRSIELSPMQREVLRSVLSRYADQYGSVAVYGSRAQGRALSGSDVDLVFYGLASPDVLWRIDLDLMDSDLSIFWNLTDYASISDPAFRREVDGWALPFLNVAEVTS